MALLGLLVLLALAGPVLATWDTCRGTCGLRPLAFDHSSLVHGYKALTSDGASPGVPSGTWPGIVGVQTVLHNGTWHMCSGALIHPQWVLTVARCFYRSRDVSIYKVVIGATDLAQPGPKAVLRDVKRLVVHHGYVATTASNDIALLELEQPVECSDYIQLGCVPDSALAVPELKTCYMAGWRATAGSGQCPRGHSLALGMRPGLAQGLGHAGCPGHSGHSGHRGHSGHSVPSLVLQEAKVRLMDVQLCNSSRWYGGAVHPQDLCAGYPRGGIDTCQGDVGAPLVCKDKVGDFFWLVGLASWGRRCSGRKRPGVFTSIQHFHGWIQEQLRLASIKPVWRPKKPGLIPSLAPFLSPTPTLMLTVLKESPEVDSDSFITISFPKDVKVILQRFFRTLQEFLEILKDRMS